MNEYNLTPLKFTEADHETAEAMAEHLRYAGNYAYTSTSAVPGLFCQGHNPADPRNRNLAHRSGVIIKTAELGFLFVQDAEDIGFTK